MTNSWPLRTICPIEIASLERPVNGISGTQPDKPEWFLGTVHRLCRATEGIFSWLIIPLPKFEVVGDCRDGGRGLAFGLIVLESGYDVIVQSKCLLTWSGI
jgi:hypothetical protein